MGDLDFDLSLKDNMTGPGKEAAAALRDVTRAMEDNAKAADHASAAHSRLAKASHEASEHAHREHGEVGGFFKSLIPEIALGELAAEGLKKAAEMAVEGVKFAIETSEFKENMVGAYSVLKGTAEEGERTFEEIDKLAGGIHMPAEKAHELAKELMLQGVKDQEAIEQTVTAISNLERMGLSGGAEKIKRIIEQSEAIGHFALPKKLAGMGVQVNDLYADIARRLHKNVKDIPALLKSGKIDVETGTAALTEAVNKGMVGKAATAKRDMKDISTDIKNSLRGIFQEADAGPLTAAFARIADSIKPGTEGAKELKEVMDSLISAGAGLVDLGKDIAGGIGGAFTEIRDVVTGALDKMKELGGWIQAHLGTAGDKAFSEQAEKDTTGRENKRFEVEAGKTWIKARAGAGGLPPDELARMDEENAKAGEMLGGSVGKGIAKGLTAEHPNVKAAGHEAGKAAIEGAREATATHSPSRKMMDIGMGMSEGLALGIDSGMDRVADAMAFDMRTPNIQPANGNAGKSISIGEVHVEVHSGASVHEIIPLLESQLTDVLERAALEAGG